MRRARTPHHKRIFPTGVRERFRGECGDIFDGLMISSRPLLVIYASLCMIGCAVQGELEDSEISRWADECQNVEDMSFIALGTIKDRNLEKFLKPTQVFKVTPRFEGKNQIFLTAKKLGPLPPNNHEVFVCIDSKGDVAFIGSQLG